VTFYKDNHPKSPSHRIRKKVLEQAPYWWIHEACAFALPWYWELGIDISFKITMLAVKRKLNQSFVNDSNFWCLIMNRWAGSRGNCFLSGMRFSIMDPHGNIPAFQSFPYCFRGLLTCRDATCVFIYSLFLLFTWFWMSLLYWLILKI
jgi:hypothetical protein